MIVSSNLATTIGINVRGQFCLMLNNRTLIYVLMESITVHVVSRLTLFEFTKQENM